ncbi:MAG TPA: PilZ domain-containing protein [Steroidobacteraceae bacterium]|nr:PilZ domain-containing protein [Steroidobacteraceae bacterium]
MPQFLGDGLVYEELLPLAWAEGPLPQGLVLARLNADNHQLLGAESSLDEVRVPEALKEESPGLLHELQRLEYKLNILLRLTAEISARSAPLPPAQPTRLGATGLEWVGARSPAVGATGLVLIYINPALPQPLRIPSAVIGERMQGAERVAQLEFRELSDSVVDLLEKLIFRHHRRLIKGTKLPPPNAR